jgi:hypothetical protein
MEPLHYCALTALISKQEGWPDLERYHAHLDDVRRRRHQRIQRVLNRLAAQQAFDTTTVRPRQLPTGQA